MFKNLNSLTLGFALFAMFFGAGNVIFPLALGQMAGEHHFSATLGIILTGVLIPLAGVFAMILFKGNTLDFFCKIGKMPGIFLALLIITLLGPLGSTPRCIALSYTTFKNFYPELSAFLFCAISCLIIFLFSFRKNRIIPLLGLFLTPLLLLSLLALIFMGFLTPHSFQPMENSQWDVFVMGLLEGYNTMDLLAAFFFSSSIYGLIKERSHHPIPLSIKGSLIAALLLALIYAGFTYLAALHGKNIVETDQLLNTLSYKIIGPWGSMLVGIIVGLACLTTAIALISTFSDFIQKEILKGKISYELTLIISLIVTFFISTLEFKGISAFLGPILEICYPGLIVLTFSNILYQLKVQKQMI